MSDLKKYFYFSIVSVVVFIIIIVYLKIYFNNLVNKKKESFTSSIPDNLNSQPWPIAEENGFKPLIVSGLNGRVLPIYRLGVSYPGSISYLIGQYLQRKVYPITLNVQESSDIILAELSASALAHKNNDGVNLGFIREPQLLGLSRVELGIRDISVLAPAYWETIYLIGNKHTSFSSLAELKQQQVEPQVMATQVMATQRIGVLEDGLIYWEAITRALGLEIGRDFLKAENDNLAELLNQLERRELDAVFLIAHTFDARLQAFLKTNETRMISIYPLSPYPQDTNMLTRPYNPLTTDLIAKFRSDMKVYIPWIFEESVSLGKAVGNKKMETVNNPDTGKNGSSIYNTFKIRAYICCSRQLGRDNKFITELGTNFLREYQSMGLLIREWGNGSNSKKPVGEMDRQQPKQLTLPTLVFSDYDSFNPDLLGAIPAEIELNPIMRGLIAKVYGRIKIESVEPSCYI